MHSHGCRLMHIGLMLPTPILEHESFSDFLSRSHAFSSHTCSCIYDLVECILMHSHGCRLMYISLEWPTPLNWTCLILIHCQSFWYILTTYMLMLYGMALMYSHTFSCMSSYVYQPRVTHTPPCTWLILRHSRSFSCILIAYMFMHYKIV